MDNPRGKSVRRFSGYEESAHVVEGKVWPVQKVVRVFKTAIHTHIRIHKYHEYHQNIMPKHVREFEFRTGHLVRVSKSHNKIVVIIWLLAYLIDEAYFNNEQWIETLKI